MIVLSDAQNHKIVRTILLGGELKQTLNARIRNSKVLRQAVVDPHQHIMRTMMSQSWMGIATECERAHCPYLFKKLTDSKDSGENGHTG